MCDLGEGGKGGVGDVTSHPTSPLPENKIKNKL